MEYFEREGTEIAQDAIFVLDGRGNLIEMEVEDDVDDN